MGGDVDCKVVILGSSAAGKSSLLERIINNNYRKMLPATVGAAFAPKLVDGVTLGLWDTAGQEQYASMSAMYYRDAKAALVCFDLTSRSSFERAHVRLFACTH